MVIERQPRFMPRDGHRIREASTNFAHLILHTGINERVIRKKQNRVKRLDHERNNRSEENKQERSFYRNNRDTANVGDSNFRWRPYIFYLG